MLAHETKGGHIVDVQVVTPQKLHKALVVVDLNAGSVLQNEWHAW